MKVLDPGHEYTLKKLDCDGPLDHPVATLRFVKREGPKFPGNVGRYPGTTLQEVLRACADRLAYVNNQEYSDHTYCAQTLIESAIWHLEARAAKRHGRTPPNEEDAVNGQTCNKCGHVGCEGACH
jgi:hypothetical protein